MILYMMYFKIFVKHTEFIVNILAQAALRVPPKVAFVMRSWPLLLPSFSLLAQEALRAPHEVAFAIGLGEILGRT